MQSSQEKYRAIFDTVSDAIIICDPESGRVLEVNRGMCEMFGYTAAEARRLHLAALWSGATGEEGGLMVKGGTGAARLWEMQARDRGGQSFWVEAHVRPAVLDGRKRMVAVLRDIEGRKRAEEELRRAKAELEIRVAERAAQLKEANEALQQELKERLQTEKSLRQSEAGYRTLVEQIPAITYTSDLEGMAEALYKSANSDHPWVFPGGIAAQPHLWQQQIHAEDALRVAAEVAKSLTAGKTLAARIPPCSPKMAASFGSGMRPGSCTTKMAGPCSCKGWLWTSPNRRKRRRPLRRPVIISGP